MSSGQRLCEHKTFVSLISQRNMFRFIIVNIELLDCHAVRRFEAGLPGFRLLSP